MLGAMGYEAGVINEKWVVFILLKVVFLRSVNLSMANLLHMEWPYYSFLS